MQLLKEFEIKGIRAFTQKQTMAFARPVRGKPGSGLTCLVGPNNGGKSTILEWIRTTALGVNLSVPRTLRNHVTDYHASLQIAWDSGHTNTLESSMADPQQLVTAPKGLGTLQVTLPLVGTTRRLPEQIDLRVVEREQHLKTGQPSAYARNPAFDLKNRFGKWRQQDSRFLGMLTQVMDFKFKFMNEGPNWLVRISGFEHDPGGLGSGIASLVHLVDCLHDAPDGSAILVDEPEISLHPTYQRRLFELLRKESERVQVIYTTHSPYMVDWESINSGACVYRVVAPTEDDGSCCIYGLSQAAADGVSKFQNNLRNPHILGLTAREVFFLHDGVILVEGQDDVVYYRLMAHSLGVSTNYEYYGWGAGGADNMPKILHVLKDLGFKKVKCVLDRNKADVKELLLAVMPTCQVTVLPVDDVRDKDGPPVIRGLCNTGGIIHEEHKEYVSTLLTKTQVD